MQTTHYLLFGISILSWAEVLLAEPHWSRQDEEGVSNIVGAGMSHDTSAQQEPEPDTLAPPIRFKVPENEMWELSLSGTIVTMKPGSETKAMQSGGPFGGEEFVMEKLQLGWESNERGTKFRGLVTFSNKRYSLKDALNHPDGKSQICVPIDVNGDVDNSVFDKFQDAMEKITKPGDSTPIRSGDAVAWFKDFHDSNGIYKYYHNSYYDENTGEYYDCSTVIQLPRLKDGNFFSHKQFLETFSKITDSSGTPLVDDMPSKGSPLSDKQIGKGIQLSPV